MTQMDIWVETTQKFLDYFDIDYKKNLDVIVGKRKTTGTSTIITKSFYFKFNSDNIYAIKRDNDTIDMTLEFVSSDIDDVLEFLFPDLLRLLFIDELLEEYV
ncbi:hypothetical protein [Marixanthomonas spongiae]|uniref:Uncharacterized protein n=1 Tax=Marixanthomonas spongiae TaxID=2174845 RepID=A0A2U0HU73_9FLAO|nr:hypothetical protein [Marixanthomonas spongiae]PVW12421.1 hypothetical protein DDV96_15020 [Marixanthomonas spongiae]